MTTPAEAHALYKQFELRRAGHGKADHASDEKYLDLLRIVEGPTNVPLHLRPARKLTDDERQRKLEGRLTHGEVFREDVLTALTAEHAARARGASLRRSEKAEREVERLRREAKRFDTP
jgi:hypothetical protein